MPNLASDLLSLLQSRSGQNISCPVLFLNSDPGFSKYTLSYGCLTELAFNSGCVFFEWPAFANLLSVYQKEQKQQTQAMSDAGQCEVSKELLLAICNLCTSPITGSLMQDPRLVLIKKFTDVAFEFRMLVLDRADEERLKKDSYEVLASQEFPILKPLIKDIKPKYQKPEKIFLVEDFSIVPPSRVEDISNLYGYSQVAQESFGRTIDYLSPWTKFLVRLFSCVRTDEEGNVLSIDQKGRHRVLAETFRDSAGMPYMPKQFLAHIQRSGNMFLVNVDTGDVLIVQRSTVSGTNPMLGLLGGFADSKEKEEEDPISVGWQAAMCKATVKLFHDSRNIKRFQGCLEGATREVVADNILDIGYPSTVMPSQEELDLIFPYLPEKVREFYSIQKPALRGLVLACSCTFQVKLSNNIFKETCESLKKEWAESRIADHVIGGELYEPVLVNSDGSIFYFVENPLRSITFPSSKQVSFWMYDHEFYLWLSHKCNLEILLDISREAVKRIIEAVSADIFPIGTEGLPSGALYMVWRMKTALNLGFFSSRPYMSMVRLAEIYRVSIEEIGRFQSAINQVWEESQGEIIELMGRRMVLSSRTIDYSATFSCVLVEKPSLPAVSAEAEKKEMLQEARGQAWDALISSSVMAAIYRYYQTPSVSSVSIDLGAASNSIVPSQSSGGVLHLFTKSLSEKLKIFGFDGARKIAFFRLWKLLSCNVPTDSDQIVDALARFSIDTEGLGDSKDNCLIMVEPVLAIMDISNMSAVYLCSRRKAEQKNGEIFGEFTELRNLLEFYGPELKNWGERESKQQFLNNLLSALHQVGQVTHGANVITICVPMSSLRYPLDSCREELNKLLGEKKDSITWLKDSFRSYSCVVEREVELCLTGLPLSCLIVELRRALHLLSPIWPRPVISSTSASKFDGSGLHREVVDSFFGNGREWKIAEALNGIIQPFLYRKDTPNFQLYCRQSVLVLVLVLQDLAFLQGSISTLSSEINQRVRNILSGLLEGSDKEFSCPEDAMNIFRILLSLKIGDSNECRLLPSPLLQAKLAKKEPRAVFSGLSSSAARNAEYLFGRACAEIYEKGYCFDNYYLMLALNSVIAVYYKGGFARSKEKCAMQELMVKIYRELISNCFYLAQKYQSSNNKNIIDMFESAAKLISLELEISQRISDETAILLQKINDKYLFKYKELLMSRIKEVRDNVEKSQKWAQEKCYLMAERYLLPELNYIENNYGNLVVFLTGKGGEIEDLRADIYKCLSSCYECILEKNSWLKIDDRMRLSVSELSEYRSLKCYFEAMAGCQDNSLLESIKRTHSAAEQLARNKMLPFLPKDVECCINMTFEGCNDDDQGRVKLAIERFTGALKIRLEALKPALPSLYLRRILEELRASISRRLMNIKKAKDDGQVPAISLKSPGDKGCIPPTDQAMTNTVLDGLSLVSIPADGDCLFSAVGLALGGMGVVDLRRVVEGYLTEHFNDFKEFYSGNERDFKKYIQLIGNTREWGGHIEIEAMQRALGVAIVVIDKVRGLTIPENLKQDGDIVFVLYNGVDHYDALILKKGKDPRAILSRIRGEGLQGYSLGSVSRYGGSDVYKKFDECRRWWKEECYSIGKKSLLELLESVCKGVTHSDSAINLEERSKIQRLIVDAYWMLGCCYMEIVEKYDDMSPELPLVLTEETETWYIRLAFRSWRSSTKKEGEFFGIVDTEKNKKLGEMRKKFPYGEYGKVLDETIFSYPEGVRGAITNFQEGCQFCEEQNYSLAKECFLVAQKSLAKVFLRVKDGDTSEIARVVHELQVRIGQRLREISVKTMPSLGGGVVDAAKQFPQKSDADVVSLLQKLVGFWSGGGRVGSETPGTELARVKSPRP